MMPPGPTPPAEARRPAALWPVVLLLALLALLAWSNRFVQDDAFISYRYAQRFAQGEGLTFNPGERVEGYTNFLWTVLIAGGMRLGFEPVAFSQVLGMACFVLSLLLCYRIGRELLDSPPAGLLAVGLLGTNYTFSAYATGGLETQLQACLLTAAAWVALRMVGPNASDHGVGCSRVSPPNDSRPETGRLAAWSLLASAALLTRLDSAVLLAPLFAVVLWRWLRQDQPVATKAWQLLCLAGPALVIVGGWLAWKYAYYGDILPNTFYAKVGGAGAKVRGLRYLIAFLEAYWLAPFALLGVASLGRLRRERRPLLLGFATLLWAAYVVSVGGDFMEFRFFVPVLPLAFVLVAWQIVGVVQAMPVRVALIATLLLGSLNHALRYDGGSIESIAQLQGHLDRPSENWSGIGQTLGRLFRDADPPVVLATTAAGAIPYFSGLTTIDMLGLNDRWVARHGTSLGSRPGHQRMASYEYLIDRGVHLAVGVPLVTPRDGSAPEAAWIENHRRQWYAELATQPLPPDARLLEIPLDARYKITVLYLTPSPAVDRTIREHALQVLPLPES